VDWIDLAQDKDCRRALVYAVVNLREFLDKLRTCQLLERTGLRNY
jgi:hypothetical protein